MRYISQLSTGYMLVTKIDWIPKPARKVDEIPRAVVLRVPSWVAKASLELLTAI
jgi:hypothetical protein